MLVVEADAQTLRSELKRGGRRRDVVDPVHPKADGVVRTPRVISNAWGQGCRGADLDSETLSQPVPKGDSVLSWPG